MVAIKYEELLFNFAEERNIDQLTAKFGQESEQYNNQDRTFYPNSKLSYGGAILPSLIEIIKPKQ